MGKRIALIEHNRPRILAIDFSQRDVEKIVQAGYNARRGATGLYDGGRFNIPWSIQDVEVVFARVTQGCFTNLEERTAQEISVEEGAFFKTLFNEVWLREGWVVLFIDSKCEPSELAHVGIENVGVLHRERVFESASEYTFLLQEYRDVKKGAVREPPRPSFPAFKSQTVVLDESEDEHAVLARYLPAASFSVLTIDKDLLLFGEKHGCQWIISDESARPVALAVRAATYSYRETINRRTVYNFGAILLLPDFGSNNIDVALGILQEVITEQNTALFDSPRHPWLEDYLPHSVNVIRQNKNNLITAFQSEYAKLEEAEKAELEQYNWLLGLLTSTDKEFEECTAEALRFLGFDVELIDEAVAPGQRKKEDLHIRDVDTGYFAIGEAKSTNRGASEGFITSLQNHQARYSRENKVPIPNGVLIVNHSTALEPAKRAARFYTDPDIAGRCREQGITAIDSTALFSMCQCVLEGSVSRDDVRHFIEGEAQIIPSYNTNIPTAEG